MGLILLVRHGQASFGSEDYDVLSELGHRQSVHTGTVLRARGVTPARVISGTLRRQRETVAGLLQGLGNPEVPVAEDPRWNEYDQHALSLFVKNPADEPLPETADPNAVFQAKLDEALKAWVEAGSSPPGGTGESHPEFRSRATTALEALHGLSGTTVVVSSGGVIGAVVASLIGVPAEGWPPLNRVTVNTSITKVVSGRRGLSLISWNDHGHVEGVDGVDVTYR